MNRAPGWVSANGVNFGRGWLARFFTKCRAGRRRTSSVYLGTLPDYAARGVEGALIHGVTDGGPAAEAGIQGGDLIVEIAGSKVANIYDYSHALDGLKVGEPINLVVMRGGERKTLQLTPSSRE